MRVVIPVTKALLDSARRANMSPIDRAIAWVNNKAHLALMFAIIVMAILLPHTPNSLAVLGPIAGGAIGMIIDSQTQLCALQAMSTVGSNLSANTYDMRDIRNIGAGEQLAIMISVTTGLAGTTPTAQFQAIQSANANLSAADILVQTDTTFLSAAKLVTGFKFALILPMHLITKEFLGLNVVLGGTTPTITITAEIVDADATQNEIVYPKNFLITS